jgi:uncharacterized membrane protein YuzA (DUF378 family)
VQQFLKVFVDIVLWRRGPQDLPASGLLVIATLVVYALVGLLQVLLLPANAAERFLYLVAGPLLLLGGLWMLLRLFGRTERWSQVTSAVLGCTALMDLVTMVPILLLGGGRVDLKPTPALTWVVLLSIVAFILVVGRILQHATDSNLLTGTAIATTYVVIMETLGGLAHASAG